MWLHTTRLINLISCASKIKEIFMIASAMPYLLETKEQIIGGYDTRFPQEMFVSEGQKQSAAAVNYFLDLFVFPVDV